MFIATFVLSALLALAFLGAGSGKVAGNNPKMLESAAHLGYSARTYQVIGALELAGAVGVAVGLWWAPLGIAAASGLVLVMAGAVISHMKAKDAFALTAPSLVLGLLAAATLVLRIATA
ncbi:DoxX family protein [Streptomyces sp. NPDC004838]